MPTQPSHSAPQDTPSPQAADTAAHRAALNEIIGMGTDFARALHGQAMAPQPAPPPAAPQPAPAPMPDAPAREALISLAAAFDRIARAVRRSITLVRSLDRPLTPIKDPAERTAARKRIIREVEDRIARIADPDERDSEANAADLHAELRDRLDAPDLDEDLATRPVADIITEICRDLGLANLPGATPWTRRTPADLAGLHARAAAPSAPTRPGPGPHAAYAQRPRDPWPDSPAAPARTQPGPAAHGPPSDPASIIAAILGHPAPAGVRWRLPGG